MSPRLILASASPQRAQLLRGLSLGFDVVASGIDESACEECNPLLRAPTLARLKAHAVAAGAQDAVVIGCDTLVVAADGTLLEKPADRSDARRMLELQSGKPSSVHSALCVVSPDTVKEGLSTSVVTFRSLTDADIAWWLQTGLWEGRSGAFQIEGPGQLLVDHLEGDWTGVVGLPVALLRQLMEETGQPFLQ